MECGQVLRHNTVKPVSGVAVGVGTILVAVSLIAFLGRFHAAQVISDKLTLAGRIGFAAGGGVLMTAALITLAARHRLLSQDENDRDLREEPFEVSSEEPAKAGDTQKAAVEAMYLDLGTTQARLMEQLETDEAPTLYAQVVQLTNALKDAGENLGDFPPLERLREQPGGGVQPGDGMQPGNGAPPTGKDKHITNGSVDHDED